MPASSRGVPGGGLPYVDVDELRLGSAMRETGRHLPAPSDRFPGRAARYAALTPRSPRTTARRLGGQAPPPVTSRNVTPPHYSTASHRQALLIGHRQRRAARRAAPRSGPHRRVHRAQATPQAPTSRAGVRFKATVAVSETYNTALENHLRDSLGLRFAERPNQDPRKRPVREIVGINPALAARWSTRRASIETRRGVLAADFQKAHGRRPNAVESLQLAQQATLETREAKHEPRGLVEQRTAWFAQAVDVLGGSDAVHAMVKQARNPAPSTAHETDTAWLDTAADRVRAALEERRSTWQVWLEVRVGGGAIGAL
jgi:TrwC relaxase